MHCHSRRRCTIMDITGDAALISKLEHLLNQPVGMACRRLRRARQPGEHVPGAGARPGPVPVARAAQQDLRPAPRRLPLRAAHRHHARHGRGLARAQGHGQARQHPPEVGLRPAVWSLEGATGQGNSCACACVGLRSRMRMLETLMELAGMLCQTSMLATNVLLLTTATARHSCTLLLYTSIFCTLHGKVRRSPQAPTYM